jgi:hypothetical protein
MPPHAFAQAASQPLIPITFNHIAEKPESIEHLSMPSRTVSVSGSAFSTSAGAQQCFSKGDQALLALGTSGKIDEHHVLSVNEHKLSFVEVMMSASSSLECYLIQFTEEQEAECG